MNRGKYFIGDAKKYFKQNFKSIVEELDDLQYIDEDLNLFVYDVETEEMLDNFGETYATPSGIIVIVQDDENFTYDFKSDFDIEANDKQINLIFHNGTQLILERDNEL